MLALQILLAGGPLAPSNGEDDETETDAAENHAKDQGKPDGLAAGRSPNLLDRHREGVQSKAGKGYPEQENQHEAEHAGPIVGSGIHAPILQETGPARKSREDEQPK